MKRFSLAAAAVIFAAMFAVSTYAQTTGNVEGKIGLINMSELAAEKGGIPKLKTALKALDDEFKPASTEIDGLYTRATALGKEIQTMQAQQASGASSTVPFNQNTYKTKVEEYQTLQTNIKRKEEDLKAKVERREPEVVGPVMAEVMKALNEFAKAKGYAAILDGLRLQESGILVGFNDKYNVTQEFITYYNARPAGSAAK